MAEFPDRVGIIEDDNRTVDADVTPEEMAGMAIVYVPGDRFVNSCNGVIVSGEELGRDGNYVLTNAHCIDGATQISVGIANGGVCNIDAFKSGWKAQGVSFANHLETAHRSNGLHHDWALLSAAGCEALQAYDKALRLRPLQTLTASGQAPAGLIVRSLYAKLKDDGFHATLVRAPIRRLSVRKRQLMAPQSAGILSAKTDADLVQGTSGSGVTTLAGSPDLFGLTSAIISIKICETFAPELKKKGDCQQNLVPAERILEGASL